MVLNILDLCLTRFLGGKNHAKYVLPDFDRHSSSVFKFSGGSFFNGWLTFKFFFSFFLLSGFVSSWPTINNFLVITIHIFKLYLLITKMISYEDWKTHRVLQVLVHTISGSKKIDPDEKLLKTKETFANFFCYQVAGITFSWRKLLYHLKNQI